MPDRRYRALLVVNGDYPADPAGLPALRGPRLDGELLRAALTDPVTGLHQQPDVRVLVDADRHTVMSALEEFFTGAGRDDQLLFYYSGHGQLDLFGRLHLCASDTRLAGLRYTAVPARDIHDLLGESRARAKVVILDCCHAGGFKGPPDLPRALAGRGRFVLASSLSTQQTQDAAEGETASPFTRFLAESLLAGAPDLDGDGYVSVEDLYRHVSDRMHEHGLSTPQRHFDDSIDSVALALAPSPATIPTAVRAPRDRALSPQVALTKFLRAHDHELAGRPWLARTGFREVADAGSGDWSLLAALRFARIAAADGAVQEAVAAYGRVAAAGHRGWSPTAAREQARLLAAQGDVTGARDAYLEGLATEDSRLSPAMAVELAILIAGEKSDATETLPRVRAYLEHASGSTDRSVAAGAGNVLGSLLAAAGHPTEARAVYRRAMLADDPYKSPVAAIALADIHERSGCRAAAIADCRAALAYSRADTAADARSRLARLESPRR
ncbi:hypothetical protein Lfu02_39700 [Longispora fulva]|uniref:Caspase domain-containing protein n=1 Tax=Longispora fulva TaxID=619741 RepID=A0A8J7GF05_9ACTN|nr:caspase family protein [Longispora fulva]MBG6136430.1 hypothetical protein [Longispora fulva]GIG59598.1 hypothetical protein Lfu02_39700 [Longispora fulva]